MRGSSPSATVSSKARPLTVTTTCAISAIPVQHLADLGERRLDARDDLGGSLFDPGGFRGALSLQPRRCVAVAQSRHPLEVQDRAFELRQGLVEFAHNANLCRAAR